MAFGKKAYEADWLRAQSEMKTSERARVEEMKRAMTEMATAGGIAVRGGPRRATVNEDDVLALQQRVKELEGYMPILLDAIEKLEVSNEELRDIVERIKPYAVNILRSDD